MTNVTNAYATGAVTGSGSNVGGLIGLAATTTITGSYATGNVTGTGTNQSGFGGLVGALNTSTINTSFATGNVTATGSGESYLGGLIGLTQNATTISDAYALGNLTGNANSTNIGGLIGALGQASNITNVYSSGSTPTQNTANYIGALIGDAYFATLTNAYWNSTTEGATGYGRVPTAYTHTPTGGGAQTTTQLTSGTMPTGFNSGTANGTPWNVSSGFTPYFSYQYPAGAQAISGHAYTSAGAAAAAASVTLYVGGTALSGGTRTTDAAGAYTALVNAGSVTSSTPLGGTLILSGGGTTLAGATFLDTPTLTSGSVLAFDLRQGVLLSTTVLTGNNALQTSLTSTFGSTAYNKFATDLAAALWQTNASGNFTVDSAISHAGAIGLTSGGNLAVNAGLTATGSTVLLSATGNVSQGSSGAVVASNLALLGGNVDLSTAAGNDVTNIAASGVGSLKYTDANALTVANLGSLNTGVTAANIKGASTATSGISAAGDITLANTAASSALTLSAAVTQTASGSTTNTFKATGNITQTANITSSGGAASVVLQADSDGSGQGQISLTNSTITTAGGQLWMGGGTSTAGTGDFTGLTVGSGYATANTNTAASYGFFMTGSTASTGAGSLYIGGKYAPATAAAGVSYGVRMINDSLSTTSGNVTIDGQASGVIAGGGGTFMAANAGNFSLSTGSGAVSVKGSATDAAGTAGGTGLGIYLQALTGTDQFTIQSTSGPVTVDGQASFANDASASNFKAALYLQSQAAGTKLNTGGTLTYGGIVGGDDVSLLHVSGAFATKTVGTARPVTITGTYGGADAANYTITTQGSSADITQATLTISGLGVADRTYNGSAAASVLTGGVQYNGLVGGDSVSIATATGLFSDKNAGVGKTVNLTSSYTGGDLANYHVVDQASTTATINPALLTISTGDVSKQYNGTTDMAGATGESAILTSGTLFSGDSLSGGTFAYRSKNVGSGTKNVLVSNVTVNDGNSGGNYMVTYATNTHSTITPAPLSYSGLTATDKVYDGDTDADVLTTGGSFTGLFGGDNVTLLSSSGTFSNKNVGNGKTVTLTNSFGGTQVSNYTISSQATTTASITPATLTVSGLGVSDRIYDGSRNAAVVTGAVQFDGLIAGDSFGISATGSFADKNVGNGKTVTLSSTYSGSDKTNYTIVDQTSTTASITPAPLTVSGITAAGKVYDGTTSASVSTGGAVFGGKVSGDDVSVSATGLFASKNAGTAKTVNLTSSYGGADASNYTITDQATATADITPKTLTLAGVTAADKVYDGNTQASVNAGGLSYTGLIGGDDVTASYAGTGVFDSKNAGTGKTVTLSSSYAGADLGNYTVVPQTSTTAAITPKAMTVSGITAADKVYDGTVAATLDTSAASYGGLVNGDAVSVNASGSFADKNVANGKTVSLTSSYVGSDAGNYTITSQPGTTASITPAALNVIGITVNSRSYDGTTIAPLDLSAVQYNGRISGDAVTLGATGSYADRHAGAAKPVSRSANPHRQGDGPRQERARGAFDADPRGRPELSAPSV